LEDPAAYPANPPKRCDIVMKGGVTSGVVYPQAVCELAQTYRFVNIGGTSAGAIAAAATAAAEHGRRRGRPGGFPEVATLPDWLGQSGHLFGLFQPQPETEPLFRILATATDQRRGGRAAALRAAVSGFRRWVLAGALLAVALPLAGILGVTAAADVTPPAEVVLWAVSLGLLVVSSLALLVVGGLAGLAWGVYRRVTGAVPKNFYGLCTGFSRSVVEGAPALTVWLTDLLDRLAGTPDGERPLTFGDLWGLDRGQRTADPQRWSARAALLAGEPREREINLEIMTTCITQARPYRFPFQTRTFYFHPGELRAFFPERVVSWMEAHPRATERGDEEADSMARGASCLPLPHPADLPVVVAARMSLSVPPLVSAVPLYAIDFSLPEAQRRVERCWFSDGGVTSNFPLHFFDAPLPRWPTFGINLRPVPPGRELQDAEGDNVRLARSNSDGLLQSWIRWEAGASGQPVEPGQAPQRGSVAGFFAAILHSMQNWTDNLQVVQPGYRDRVVNVHLADSEGGMNLQMPAGVIRRLTERGRCAGERLRRRFATPEGDGTELTWDNHRWLRYRRMMASLERFLAAFSAAYRSSADGEKTFAALTERDADEPPGSYRWRNRLQREAAVRTTQGLIAQAESSEEAGTSLRDGAPQPENPLRMVPPQ
jgi:hypothetical protein